MTVQKRKLIEVALPLEAMNREAARENYIYKGNPSTVHKWWAQRPLAICRAVLFAQLVDDPSSQPEKFPTEAAQAAERQRLFRIIEQLVVWENSTNERLLREAYEEIWKSTNGAPPEIVDPFAGGGSIPLEAQRLGLQAHASDLNPVAVLINRALLEIPAKWGGRRPVFPGAADTRLNWPDAHGLSEDIKRYGDWLRETAESRSADLYPELLDREGKPIEVIAWLWATTVECPNPACGIRMPLMRSRWLSKRKGKECYLDPAVAEDEQGDRRIVFEIRRGPAGAPTAALDGTVSKAGARCLACGTSVPLTYIREQGVKQALGTQLLAMAAQGKGRRFYIEATAEQEHAAAVGLPAAVPDGALSTHPQYMGTPRYGFTKYSDLFTHRQLTLLALCSDLVLEARQKVVQDALTAGLPQSDVPLELGGLGAEAYGDSIALFLAFAIDKLADYGCRLAVWDAKDDRPKNLFARQAIPMVWDFPEIAPFSGIGGALEACVRITAESLLSLRSFRGAAGDRQPGRRCISWIRRFGGVNGSSLLRQHPIRRSFRLLLRMVAPLCRRAVPRVDGHFAGPQSCGACRGPGSLRW